MSNIPEDLKYTESHEWVRVEADGSVTVGITDYAQSSLGDVVHLELPAVGKVVEAGQDVAVVESVKAASDIYSPLSGEIIAANDALAGSPEQLNADAYSAWLFKLKPSNPSELGELLSPTAYAQSSD
ncbi:glycine cleavage system protein GcvH [Massilia sp. W12]|uniref:glycine cleavage system protein GcvH n=1 Tax=Massilia sp. W12 TaxID=3126507 RepID=UPI0030CC705E